jgi:hypothetical protein
MVGEHKIKVGAILTIRLVFWVELGPEPYCCGFGGPRPDGAPTRVYSGPDRIPLRHCNRLYTGPHLYSFMLLTSDLL